MLTAEMIACPFSSQLQIAFKGLRHPAPLTAATSSQDTRGGLCPCVSRKAEHRGGKMCPCSTLTLREGAPSLLAK